MHPSHFTLMPEPQLQKFDMTGMDGIVITDNNTPPMKTLLTNKNVLVTDTDEYILIKIPKQHKAPAHKQPSWESLVGVLKDVPAFKGKTSVQVQDMIQDAWATQTRNNLNS